MVKHSGMWLHSRLKGYHDTCKSICPLKVFISNVLIALWSMLYTDLGYSIKKNATETLSGKWCSCKSTQSLRYQILNKNFKNFATRLVGPIPRVRHLSVTIHRKWDMLCSIPEQYNDKQSILSMNKSLNTQTKIKQSTKQTLGRSPCPSSIFRLFEIRCNLSRTANRRLTHSNAETTI